MIWKRCRFAAHSARYAIQAWDSILPQRRILGRVAIEGDRRF